MIAAHQNGVVDLVGGELHLMGQGVEQVLTLEGLGHHALDVRQPHRHIPRRGLGAGVAPAVAVNQTVTGDQDGCASGVGDTGQCFGSLGLPVLIERHGRLDAALGVVNRLAVYVPEQGVEGATRQFAPVLPGVCAGPPLSVTHCKNIRESKSTQCECRQQYARLAGM